MLNPFPIQFLSLLGYFILRVVIGFALLILAERHWKMRHSLSQVLTLPIFPFGTFTTYMFIGVELIVGSMFILGFYTQIAALIGITMSIKMLFLRNRFDHESLPSKMVYFLFIGICLTLLITGAGVFAFDLPI